MPHSTDNSYLTEAVRILTRTPLIDGHNDLPWQFRSRVDNHLEAINIEADTAVLDPPMHTDINRLRRGRLGGQFWSLYLPARLEGPGVARVLFEQIDVTLRLIDRHSEVFEQATSADEVERIFSSGRIASVLAIEGGYAIENSLAVLRQAYRCGARYMTLTHNDNTDWADSATDEPRHDGLTAFGREVVREMNRLGMIVDLSHVAPSTMHDALDTSEAPVLFSHSNARALCNHPRNVPDDVLERVRDVGGVVMATFVPPFVSAEARDHRIASEDEQHRLQAAVAAEGLNGAAAAAAVDQRMNEWLQTTPAPRATLEQVADHIDYLRDTVGINGVGIGSDFDGITTVPVGLEDVSTYPALIAELLRRGYSAGAVAKVAGQNLLRLMREVEGAATRIASTRTPSDVLFEELDGASP